MKLIPLCVAASICLLGQPSAAAQPARAVERRVVIESAGWRLVGDLSLPRARRPAAAVILLNKAAGDRHAYRDLARHLSARGVASFRLDLRGHGESVNRGKFDPGQPPERRLQLGGEEDDVCAAFRYLRSLPGIDPRRIGFVGASYSGEAMVACARKYEYGRAYVALSPGSFSDESADSIDRSGIPWLFVKSTQERSRVMQDFLAALRRRSRTAQTMEVGGTEHATDILKAHPELAEIIAAWLAHHLR